MSATDCCLHWLTPFGLSQMHLVSALMPPVLIAREHVILVRVVKPKMLSNYGAGLRFTQFCDTFNIPKELNMPAPEWLLSMFITTKGAGEGCWRQHPQYLALGTPIMTCHQWCTLMGCSHSQVCSTRFKICGPCCPQPAKMCL